MSRKKNILNEKNRLFSCSATSSVITYKIPIRDESTLLGHFIEYSIVDDELVFKFSTKKPEAAPAFYIETFEVPQLLLFN